MPPNPGLQIHRKLLCWSSQMALFWHGWDWHSSTSCSQSSPANPGSQVHL